MKILLIPCFFALLLLGCGEFPPYKAGTPLSLLQENQIDSTNFELFLRAFKKEQILEVWAKNKSTKAFSQIQTYDFCTTSGTLSPKRQEGDRQIPEGCYWIDRFNPNSLFHLSLGLNYPNDSDRKLGDAQEPGTNIFIHGGCASVGCIPITNKNIDVVYTLAYEAKRLGQKKIPVHIFPSNKMETLLQNTNKNEAFWQNLLPIFKYFETTQQLPKVWIKPNGTYAIAK